MVWLLFCLHAAQGRLVSARAQGRHSHVWFSAPQLYIEKGRARTAVSQVQILEPRHQGDWSSLPGGRSGAKAERHAKRFFLEPAPCRFGLQPISQVKIVSLRTLTHNDGYVGRVLDLHGVTYGWKMAFGRRSRLRRPCHRQHSSCPLYQSSWQQLCHTLKL